MGDDEAKKAAAAAAANAATSRRIKTFAHEQPKGYSTNVRPRYGTSFGTMISSEKQTAPSAGMGSSNREHKSRVHISEEHSLNSMRGTYSPGPIYKPRTRTDEILDASERKLTLEKSKGKKPVYLQGQLPRFPHYEDAKKQVEMRHWRRVTGRLDGTPGPGVYEERSSLFEQTSSRKPTLPAVHFSRAERGSKRVFISNEHSTVDPLPLEKAPGPGEYKQQSSIFAQVDSRKDSMPNVVMAKSKRFEYQKERKVAPLVVPGPGAHTTGEGAFTKQTVSYKKSNPQYGFGSCERKGRDKMYISQALVKEHFGKNSPGPVTGTRQDAVGKQVDSRKKTQGSCKFGSAPRFTYFSFGRAEMPGPGQYGVQ